MNMHLPYAPSPANEGIPDNLGHQVCTTRFALIHCFVSHRGCASVQDHKHLPSLDMGHVDYHHRILVDYNCECVKLDVDAYLTVQSLRLSGFSIYIIVPVSISVRAALPKSDLLHAQLSEAE